MAESIHPEPRLKLPLRVWIPVLALACVLALGAVVARDALTGMEEGLTRQQEGRLRDLATLQAGLIENRLAEMRDALADHAARPATRAAVRDLVTAHRVGPALGGPVAAALRASAADTAAEGLALLRVALHLAAIDVLDPDGRPLRVGPDPDAWLTPSHLAAARTLVATGSPGLSMARVAVEDAHGHHHHDGGGTHAAHGGAEEWMVVAAAPLGDGRGGPRPHVVATLGTGALNLSDIGDGIRLDLVPTGRDARIADGLGAVVPVDFAGLDLAVRARAPASFVEAPLASVRGGMIRDAAVLLALIVAVLVGAGYLASRSAVRLLAAARRMGEGDLEGLDLPVGQRDEVGEIARALALLASHLRDGRAATETALMRSAALDAGSAAIAIADGEGIVRYVSPAAEALLAQNPPIGAGVEEGRRLAIADQSDLARSAAPVATDVPTATGRLQVRASPVLDAGMLRRGTVVEFTDVTETRRLAATVGAIDTAMPMMEFDRDGGIVPVNALARDMLARLQAPAVLLDAVAAPIQRAGEAGHSSARVALADAGGDPLRLVGSFASLRGTDGSAYRVLGLFVDVTVQTLAAERAEADREALQTEQAEVVERLRAALSALARGDLSRPLRPLAGARHADLHHDFEHARSNLRDALSTIRHKADGIRSAVGDVAEEGRELARRTAHQTDDLEGSAASLERLARDLRNVALLAERTDGSVERARAAARRTREVVARTAVAMDQISGSSTRISSVLDVLGEIALQTDLLALNAGIAAARAGPAGRGFAAVADEIRALARRAATAAGEIGDVVSEAGAHVAGGVDAVAEAGAALTEVGGQVESIASAMASFVDTARAQSASVGALSETMSTLDRATRVTTGLLEDGVQDSTMLAQEAAALLSEVDRFALSHRAGPDEAAA
ncbi:methyl-accepting chemotaxis protein [Jannaschia sp. Os4]|uniref:methyl-accepting chemotaxis protein n=1 Tax=Jannaschia sp. Os4 TaxID=2807617 RepID=UPI001939B03A|nr:methyl-accepting chemotaxis protein [Jannaschia sp. Os4]MBM2576450.1 methyl-accepting chemotaxis protein [Jannaschia sp. Os4]